MKVLRLHPDLVIKIVNSYVHTDVRKNTTTREKKYVEPRQLAMYFLYQYTDLSVSGVGKMFGKHHATVLHALKCIPDFIQFDEKLRKLFVSIRSNLLKNSHTMKQYSTQTRFQSIADDLTETKRLNAKLIHRAINLKAVIDSMPMNIKLKYFGDDEYIYTAKPKNYGVGMVYQS